MESRHQQPHYAILGEINADFQYRIHLSTNRVNWKRFTGYNKTTETLSKASMFALNHFLQQSRANKWLHWFSNETLPFPFLFYYNKLLFDSSKPHFLLCRPLAMSHHLKFGKFCKDEDTQSPWAIWPSVSPEARDTASLWVVNRLHYPNCPSL